MMTRFVKLRNLLPILILTVILQGSCKKEETGPETVSGTVWKTPMLDLKIYELQFLDEGMVEHRIHNYSIHHIGILNDTFEVMVSYTNDYTFNNPTLEIYDKPKLNFTLNGGKLIGDDLVYSKQ